MSSIAGRLIAGIVLTVAVAGAVAHAERSAAPVYVWLEADWFSGVKGAFATWAGSGKPEGAWRIAGPGVSAEWSQGGESEWNSMVVPAAETQALAGRELVVPRAGDYRLWVRYVDHRDKKEPFVVRVLVGGKPIVERVLGNDPVVPLNDEYQLYWGYSFGWGTVDARLPAGPARIELAIDRAGEAFRQVDAVLLTDDLAYRPVAREKPPFGYLASFALPAPAGLRGSGRGIPVGAGVHRPLLGGADFTMWTRVLLDAKSLAGHALETITARELFLLSAPARGIREAFLKRFAAAKEVPIVGWPRLRPVLYLGDFNLAGGSPLRAFLERTKLAFAVLTNYARPTWDDRVAQGSYQALTGALSGQFLGFIHGEGLGSPGVGDLHDQPFAPTRRAHVDAFGRDLIVQQAKAWTSVFHTPADPALFARGISCLGSDLVNAMAHQLKERGARVTGYEEDATIPHVPLRLAFQRGAARQYGGTFINYASGNFGDACNYFTQDPIVNRGAGGWFHSKYSVTDGVTIGWYRKLYYLNYLGGASAIFWEQGLENQWIKPGPGEHEVELSPFGRVTVEFQRFVDRVPDRGEPVTPVALLLSYGAGYERASYRSRMHDVFDETADDLELRELLNVLYHPSGVVEGLPAAPDVQSLPNGVFGNLYDVLVDRPERAQALLSYPVVWAAGEVALAPLASTLREFLRRGGTLVTTLAAANGLDPTWTGVKATGGRTTQSAWQPAADSPALRETTPYEVENVTLDGATVLATSERGLPLAVRHAVGEGAIVTLLVPHGLGLDERAHPLLPVLARGLFAGLLPFEVRLADGSPLGGEIQYQLNRTKTGWLLMLVNNRGVDKTQSGIARVDRTARVSLLVRSTLPLRSARELTQPRGLPIVEGKDRGTREVAISVEPGDLQVLDLR